MSRFLTLLEAELLDDTERWRLKAPLVYQSDVANATFTVPRGFITDFASVPRLPFAYLLAGGTAHRAAVLHDALYRRHIVSRSLADRIFREAMAITDISWWRRWLMWAAVRVGGRGAWNG